MIMETINQVQKKSYKTFFLYNMIRNNFDLLLLLIFVGLIVYILLRDQNTFEFLAEYGAYYCNAYNEWYCL